MWEGNWKSQNNVDNVGQVSIREEGLSVNISRDGHFTSFKRHWSIEIFLCFVSAAVYVCVNWVT